MTLILYERCKKISPLVLLLLGIPMWAAAQVLNTPIIAVYRFGIYGLSFLLGYFIFAHDEVVDRLGKYWIILAAAAVLLGCGYVSVYFGENYAIEPVVNSPFSIAYGWLVILSLFAGMKKWGNKTSSVSAWMTKKSFGLYVFHYLPLAAAAYFMHRYGRVPAIASYLISGVAAFGGGYLLYEIIARIPFLRWCVLGMKKGEI